MLLIDDLLLAPINGFKFILGQIQKLADQELNDDTVIKEQLLELQMRLELDEVSEDELRGALVIIDRSRIRVRPRRPGGSS